ncbi:OmpL47-type beta-barrel domain-containing protein [Methanocella paludicola]|nr:carboxypeptidase regulatory-like domain-containing protein [Methanocella paludicola]
MKPSLVKLFLIILMASACCAPACSVPPVIVTAGPTIFEGSVQGHVLAAGTNASIPGAKVWLVNATRDNTIYGATAADSGGHFYFINVPPLGPGAYRLKAQKDSNTGFTTPFGVASLENRTVDVYVRMMPAAIGIEASRSYVVADGRDHMGITVLVNDSMGRPVAGGYPVTFRAAGHPAGSLFGSIVPESAVTGMDGRATAEYVWVGETGAASHVIIEASAGAGLNASLVVDIRLPDTTPPATTLKAAGEPDNVGGFISDVTVTLDASDHGGWGVNETFYRTGDSGWARYTGPFTISAEGGTTVYYYSTDKAGNVETPKSRAIVIHKK